MRTRMKSLPKQYDDKDNLFCFSRRQPKPPRDMLFVEDNDVALASENVFPMANQFGMEVVLLESSGMIMQKLLEKDTIIEELTMKLDEFKRIHSFMPSKLSLPDDYFEDLVE